MLSKSMDAGSDLDIFLDFVLMRRQYSYPLMKKNGEAKDVVMVNPVVPPSCTEDYKGI